MPDAALHNISPGSPEAALLAALGRRSLVLVGIVLVVMTLLMNGLAIWLRADFDVLMRRIKRRSDRPLLRTADPAATLRELMDKRYPVYALADLTIESRDVPHDVIVDEIVDGLHAMLCGAPVPAKPVAEKLP